MRRASKQDGNHGIIAEAFKKLGWSWANTHQIGKGFPDGVAGKHKRNLLIEIKDGSLAPSAQKLTDDEKDFHRDWQGDVRIVRCVDDVIAVNSEFSL